MMVPEWALKNLDTLQLDDETKRRFLGENARAVFRL